MLYIYLYFTLSINFNGYNLFYNDHDVHNKVNLPKSPYRAPPDLYRCTLSFTSHPLLRGYKAQKYLVANYIKTLVFVLSIR